MASKLNLEIVTPERSLFSGSVEQVAVPGADGELGILPGHAALVSKLGVGVITYHQEGQVTHLYCCCGFVEVLPESVSVLADEALAKQELDVRRAEEQKAEAEALLRSRDPNTDYEAARRQYQEAVAKLEVLSR